MKSLVKYLGAFIILLGVLILVIYYLGTQTNTILVSAFVTMVLGIIVHIYVNKLFSK